MRICIRSTGSRRDLDGDGKPDSLAKTFLHGDGMMRTMTKTSLASLACLLLLAAPAAADSSIAIQGDTVLVDGKPFLRFRRVTPEGSYYIVKGVDGRDQAGLTFTSYPGRVFFNARFPALGRFFQANFPAGTTFEKVIASFIQNKVFVDGKPSLPGVQKYCADRGLPLRGDDDPLPERPAAPPPQFSPPSSWPSRPPSGAGPRQPPSPTEPATVGFTLRNNSSRDVRIFIGSRPKYGSGRTTRATAHSIASEHGIRGDQVCIVDERDNPITCTTLSPGMSSVEINPSGTGFGNL
jgi:hypothetical protein